MWCWGWWDSRGVDEGRNTRMHVRVHVCVCAAGTCPTIKHGWLHQLSASRSPRLLTLTFYLQPKDKDVSEAHTRGSAHPSVLRYVREKGGLRELASLSLECSGPPSILLLFLIRFQRFPESLNHLANGFFPTSTSIFPLSSHTHTFIPAQRSLTYELMKPSKISAGYFFFFQNKTAF